VFLKGNHEAFVGGFLEDPTSLGAWSQFGGLETLMSYGIFPALRANAAEQQEIAAAFARRLPQAHRRFLNKLRLSFSCGDYFFAHAGARPGTALADQKEDDLLWIREDFLLHEQDFGKIVVHGHTPVREPDIRPNRINIDTGAYVTGQLTCLLLEGEEMYFL
jgi:serine/threonine protein phosphatase 1